MLVDLKHFPFVFFFISELCDHRAYWRLVWHSSHIGQTTHRTVTWQKDCCWAKVVCVWSRADRVWTGRVSFRGTLLFMIICTHGRRIRAWSWNVSSFKLSWLILLLSNRLPRHWCCDFMPTPPDVHDGMWNSDSIATPMRFPYRWPLCLVMEDSQVVLTSSFWGSILYR